jgi:hypothetical protein
MCMKTHIYLIITQYLDALGRLGIMHRIVAAARLLRAVRGSTRIAGDFAIPGRCL